MIISSTKGIGVNALKMLVYGPSGVGKTSLAMTIKEPLLLISAEAGLLPLRHSEIDVIDLTTVTKDKRIDMLAEAYTYLMTPEAQKKYKWIMIDSLSELSQNLVEKLQVEFPDRKDSLVLYGENAKRMRSIVKLFRDLPHYNVIFTALDETEKDDNGMRFQTIQMIGKISQQLPAYFDEVFYMTTIEGVRKLVTGKSEKLVAKDRSGALEQFEPADLGLIVAKIRKTNDTKEKIK